MSVDRWVASLRSQRVLRSCCFSLARRSRSATTAAQGTVRQEASAPTKGERRREGNDGTTRKPLPHPLVLPFARAYIRGERSRGVRVNLKLEMCISHRDLLNVMAATSALAASTPPRGHQFHPSMFLFVSSFAISLVAPLLPPSHASIEWRSDARTNSGGASHHSSNLNPAPTGTRHRLLSLAPLLWGSVLLPLRSASFAAATRAFNSNTASCSQASCSALCSLLL